MKLPKPESYDGKPTTPFRPWWKTVRHYFRFYPNTLDAQRIAFVGALLTNDAKEWHQERDEMVTENGEDTWVAYSAAIQAEYLDQREGASAHVQLKALEYKGKVKAYLTAFMTLNRRAGSSGEDMQDIINNALPNNIIDVRFYQDPHLVRTDEDFLVATYEAGRQVEELQALEARKTAKNAGKPKDVPGRNTPTPKRNLEKPSSTVEKTDTRPYEAPSYSREKRWASEAAALAGVPPTDKNKFRNCPGCNRCGRTGHSSPKCYAWTTKNGTNLPTPPWRVSAGTKRPREEDAEPMPARKAQKISSVETMELEPAVAPWSDSDRILLSTDI
jgi:hypothetical protein